MATAHKNKTLATFLAFTVGVAGFHRFYLQGWNDIWGWLHVAAVLLTGILIRMFPEQPWVFTGLPFILSWLLALLSALVLGLKSDEQWDATYNLDSGKNSQSRWPLVLLLALSLALAFTVLIALLARVTDLYHTGGAFG